MKTLRFIKIKWLQPYTKQQVWNYIPKPEDSYI